MLYRMKQNRNLEQLGTDFRVSTILLCCCFLCFFFPFFIPGCQKENTFPKFILCPGNSPLPGTSKLLNLRFRETWSLLFNLTLLTIYLFVVTNSTLVSLMIHRYQIFILGMGLCMPNNRTLVIYVVIYYLHELLLLNRSYSHSQTCQIRTIQKSEFL